MRAVARPPMLEASDATKALVQKALAEYQAR